MAVKGFITKAITKDPKKKVGCEKCGLAKDCKNAKIGVAGQGAKKLLIIGDFPSESEDKLGKIYSGDSGKILRDELRMLGYDLDRDFWYVPAVRCRSDKKDGPTKVQVECCKPKLDADIKALNPTAILLMGKTALKSMFGGRDIGDASEELWRHLCIPDRELGKFLLPTYPPSWALKNRDGQHIFSKDLRWALSCTTEQFPQFADETKAVHQLTDFDELIKHLNLLLKKKPAIAFDYETSNLKPYAPGEKIWSISWSADGILGHAFPYQYPKAWTTEQFEDIKELWSQVLEDLGIPKFAHNIRMEDSWSRHVVGVEPVNWQWDSMIAAHILEERPDYTGLKFQTYINWGLAGYEADAHKWIKPVNKLHECPIKTLLLYNGMDSIFTYRLRRQQQKFMSRNPKAGVRYNNYTAYKLFHDGMLALNDVSDAGVSVNEQYFVEVEKKLAITIAETEKALFESGEATMFQRRMGRPIGLGSSDDLKLLFFDMLKMTPVKKTASGASSVDADTMEQLDHPFARKIVELRKLGKIHGTYLAQFMREIQAGKMHPNFNLHFVRTHRSSSDSPNFQNIPVRDELAKAYIRKGIVPRVGHRLMEVDYGAMEVRIIACFSKDPILCKQIRDDFDMHRYWASIVFQKPQDQITKAERQNAKNQFVFPLFYGSYWRSVSREMGLDEEHIKRCEARFWLEYKATKKWQDDLIASYGKTGRVEMKWGHHRGGFLSKNMIINSPVQGSAFHCLLWSLIELNKIRKAEGWLSCICGQIHDSMFISVHPDEEEHVIQTIVDVMTTRIAAANPWIIVPLLAEVDACPDLYFPDAILAEGIEQKSSWYFKSTVSLEKFGIFSSVED